MNATSDRVGASGGSVLWFHRNIGRMETEKLLLEKREDGSFLIRESDTVKGAYVLSTIYQTRIHHYRIIPNADGNLAIQAQQGVQKQLFVTLEDLVEFYSHPKRGLVCALTKPIAQLGDEDIQDEQEESDDEQETETDEEQKEENVISKFLLASLSTLSTSSVDEGFLERLKAYLSGDLTADVHSMSTPSPQLSHLKQLLSNDCHSMHKQLDRLMVQVDLLQSLFERAGGAKDVSRRSSFAQKRSRDEEGDFDSLSLKLKDCSDSLQNLENTAFQMLHELSASMIESKNSGAAITTGSGSTNHLPALESSDEPENEDEVAFEVKTEASLSGKKALTISVNLREGRLTFRKQGEISQGTVFSHLQVLQMVKSRSKEQRLGILMAGSNRKDYNFDSMQAREHFCQLIQLIRNRMKAGGDQDSVSLFVGTWNMGDQGPPSDISSWFRSVGLGKTLPLALAQPHDIYAIGTQECNISEKEWISKIRSTLKSLYDIDYEKVTSQTLWGIRLVILVKPEHTNMITHIQASQVRTGIGNALGNKGAVGISFYYGSVSMCFINAHLTSGNEKCHRRNQNYHDILKGMSTLKHRRLNQFFLTNHFHHLFFFGDLNYRVDLGATEIVEFAKRQEHNAICREDQLRKDKEKNKIFVGFDEAPILFPPTYRFARGRHSLDDYVWVKQKRSRIRINVPSYCDRVLWCSYPGTLISNSSYGACSDIMTSDHSPLFASFQVGGVRQYVPEAPTHGVGTQDNNTFIILDSVKAKIQTSSKTYFYMEVLSECFQGAHKSGPNNEWIDTQAGYVWPVWCGRDYVAKIKPIVTDLDYLEQQHLLIQLKSLESDEPYAECCLSLRGIFSPKPISVQKTLIHQGQVVGELDGYIHVTLDEYRKPEEELYCDANFILAETETTEMDISGQKRGRLGTNTALERLTHHASQAPVASKPVSYAMNRKGSCGAQANNSTAPPVPRRRDTTSRPPVPIPHSARPTSQPPTVPVRRAESLVIKQRSSSNIVNAPNDSTIPPAPHVRPRATGGSSNPPVPNRRSRTGSKEMEGPQVPRRHFGRDLDLPPPLPPKSPEPSLASEQERTSAIEQLLTFHGLSQYFNTLVTNGYDDIGFIGDITDEELQTIGVKQSSERQRLLKIFETYKS